MDIIRQDLGICPQHNILFDRYVLYDVHVVQDASYCYPALTFLTLHADNDLHALDQYRCNCS